MFDVINYIKDNSKLSFIKILENIKKEVGSNNFTRIIKKAYIDYKDEFDDIFKEIGQTEWKYIGLFLDNKLNKCPVCGRYCLKKTCSKECSKKYSYAENEFKELMLREKDFEESLKILLYKHGSNRFTSYIAKLYSNYKTDFDNLFNKIGSEDLTYVNLYLQDKLCKCKICGKTIKKPRIYCSYACENKGKDFSEINSRKDYETIGKNISKGLQNVDFEKAFLRRQETRLKKYGDKNYTNREKAKQTCLEKYGKESYCSTDEFKKIISEKYNSKSDEEKWIAHEKRIKTNIEKYGSPNNARIHFKHKENFNKSFIENNFIKNKIFNLENCCAYFNIHATTAYQYLRLWDIKYRKHSVSHSEINLFEWIPIENKISNIRSIISPYELDIYLPDYKLAIEYNGSYFHSQVDKNYHKIKTDLCNSKGIQLLHIFDFDDLDIWKSIILNKLGLSKKLYARNCTLKELEYREVKDFLIENHLQGTVSSSINLGLFYNEELVEVMTFGKSRFDKNYDYELLRLCTKKGLNIIGGASKLFKYFTSKYKGSIISYANRRFSNGKIYELLGFTKEHISSPNYWYTDGSEVLSRYQCQKHKLNSLLENFDSELSEYENMTNNGYLRIYDCGNIVYKYNK